ncbi:SpoIIE family protein phosphatase [Nocardioides perillae]|uniref:PAS domain S-box-containing protein n=1 Tax=Nocardioides perillae TaxID=1119534 RepID=A0A7Y9RTA9_9ACTN|nr:SpoIIE family protein phosphatase [Nocardioides perillae]NYG54934.1 PAS domain S-box-containing protein [Nocardioides perillae]
MTHPSGRSDGSGFTTPPPVVPPQPARSAAPATASTGPTATLSPGSVLEHAPYGVLVGDLSGALLSWNRAAAELLGLDEAAMGSAISSWFGDPTPVDDAFGLAQAGLLDGRSPTHLVHTRDGAVHEITAVPTRLEGEQSAVLVLINDVTERTRAVNRHDRLKAQVALLNQVSETLSGAPDADEAMDRLAQLVVPRMADWVTMNTYDERGRTVRSHVLHSDPDFAALAAVTGDELPDAVSEELPSRRLARGEPAILIERVTEEHLEAFVPDPEVRAMLRDLDVHSAMAVPMPGTSRVMGSMVLVNRAASPTFTAEDLAVATELARRGGVALERVAAAAEQRELATALQASMLTEPPVLPDAEVEVRYEPASHAAQVGGDWYDVFVERSGSVVLSIGDVSGHDPQAAAMMGQIRALLRGLAFGTESGPADLLTHLDTTLDALGMRATATSVVARLLPAGDDGSRVVAWSNAGHLPPVLVPAPVDGVRQPARALESPPNVLLGLWPEAARDEHRVELEPGAVLLFYTDGLVERRREVIDAGVGRLLSAVDALAVGDDLPLGELCDSLLEKLLPGQGDDDVALLAVRLRG